MTRILIVDDNPSVRAALRMCFKMKTDWIVCGEAGTHAVSDDQSITINRIGEVTTVTTLDRNTGKVTSEKFFGNSPYGKEVREGPPLLEGWLTASSKSYGIAGSDGFNRFHDRANPVHVFGEYGANASSGSQL